MPITPTLLGVLQLAAAALEPATDRSRAHHVSEAAESTAAVVADSVPVFHGRNGGTRVRMPAATDLAVERDVRIDGSLDEAAWRSAPILTGFSLYSPSDGRPAPDSTEVRVWYSPTAMYIGVRAFEPHGAVRATLADRDRVSSDDNIEIHLDTFEERRRAFVFIVNPLGVQADGTKAEGGGFIPGANVAPGQTDLSPDFQWQSRGTVHDWGYETELRIPFSSLRFPSRDLQRWGLQVIRKVQHSGYEQTWTPALRASASFIAQEGWIEGMRGLQHGVDVTLNPELTTTLNGAREAAVGGAPGEWRYRNTPRLGGNVRAGLGSNFVLNGTVRPDFSQVEADALQVAADTRFALFYPERRPFFVEGSDQFNVPNTLVYTRRIVQPDAALKLTGRLGRMNVSLLSALDAAPAGLPDPRLADKPLVDVVRLTRDFAEQSQGGLVYSERVRRGASNRMIGADVRHVFGRLYYASLQLAGSRTSERGVSRTGALWEAVVDRTGRSYGFHYNLLGIQPGFRADNGFVARTGFVQPNAANRFTIFGRPGGLFERYNVFLSANGIWKYDDFFRGRSVLESRLSANNQFTFRGGWSLALNPALATFAFDPAAYRTLRLPSGDTSAVPFVPSDRITTGVFTTTVTTPQYRRFAAGVGATIAHDVDFLETSRVRRVAYSASLDLRPTAKVRVNATYNSQAFTRRVDGFASYATGVPRVKMEYQIARPVFVRLVSQYERTRREALRDPRTGEILLTARPDGSIVPVSRTSTGLVRTDALFSYRPRPGVVFFAGYGASTRDADGEGDAFGMTRESDGLFLKASWLFQQRSKR